MTNAHGAPPPPAPAKDVPAWRLLATLGAAGGLAGFLIVFVYGWTQPIIQRNKAERLAAAVEEVLERPARYDTLYVVDGQLTKDLPEGADPAKLEAVYEGYGDDGRAIGFAIPAAEPGFQDVIELIFGYDPGSQALLGMKVLDSKETPGLGSKIESDTGFVNQFGRVKAPIKGVKSRNATGDPHEIDMITGATISSRAVIRIITDALDRMGPMLDAYQAAPSAAGGNR